MADKRPAAISMPTTNIMTVAPKVNPVHVQAEVSVGRTRRADVIETIARRLLPTKPLVRALSEVCMFSPPHAGSWLPSRWRRQALCSSRKVVLRHQAGSEHV